MTAKEYLQTAYNIQCRIDRLNMRRLDLRNELYSYGIKSPDSEPVQTSISGDRLSEVIGMVDEVERKMVAEIRSLIQQKKTIAAQIETLPNERYRRVLFDRYILCKRWELIATEYDKNIRWVYRMHGRALKLFEEKVEYDHCKATI